MKKGFSVKSPRVPKLPGRTPTHHNRLAPEVVKAFGGDVPPEIRRGVKPLRIKKN